MLIMSMVDKSVQWICQHFDKRERERRVLNMIQSELRDQEKKIYSYVAIIYSFVYVWRTKNTVFCISGISSR